MRGLRRIKKRLELGKRWLKCGWRLFGRNPWLLGGMGFSCAFLISVLLLIPLVGGLLIALLAPMLLASAYLVIDTVSNQRMALPASLRLAAVMRSPKELVSVFRNEEYLLPTLVASIYSLAVVLLINLLVRLVAGNAWVGHWMNLDILSFLGVFATALFAFVLYFMLAASLIYALPLAFLQNEALLPAIGRSLKSCARYIFALLILLGLMVAFFLLGHISAYFSVWAAFFVWLVIGTVVFPIVATSLYCSYRTVFPVNQAANET
jgi:hypothetical protein